MKISLICSGVILGLVLMGCGGSPQEEFVQACKDADGSEVLCDCQGEIISAKITDEEFAELTDSLNKTGQIENVSKNAQDAYLNSMGGAMSCAAKVMK